MDLQTMESLAADLSALGDRVDALEKNAAASFAPINTFIYTEEGVKQIFEGLKWAGPWDRESAYEPFEIVRYNKKTFLNLFMVKQSVPAGVTGGPLKLVVEGLIPSGEKIEDFVFPEDPLGPGGPFKEGKGYKYKAWEIRAEKGTITIPETGTNKSPRLFLCVVNDKGEFAAQNFEEFKAVALGATTTNKYWLIEGATSSNEAESPPWPVPAPFELVLTLSAPIAVAGNPNPETDKAHWQEI
jgi:hypothetical protein